MAVDLLSIVLGLVAAAIPCLGWVWHLQQRHAAQQRQWALLEERLSTALLAQQGLQAQLDASRDEISDLAEANSAKQAS
ncbi:DNA recombination protein RmuC, partial [Pseudomonas shirazensis]